MDNCNINAFLTTPKVDAFTFQSGPRGIGIKSITQDGNTIIITYDDGKTSSLTFPDWWFGTRREYNNLSANDKMRYYIFFIEEGT